MSPQFVAAVVNASHALPIAEALDLIRCLLEEAGDVPEVADLRHAWIQMHEGHCQLRLALQDLPKQCTNSP